MPVVALAFSGATCRDHFKARSRRGTAAANRANGTAAAPTRSRGKHSALIFRSLYLSLLVDYIFDAPVLLVPGLMAQFAFCFGFTFDCKKLTNVLFFVVKW